MGSDHRLADYAIVYVALLLFFGVGAITTLGLSWYATLALPSPMPSQLVVATIWCVLFLLGALSAIRYWGEALRTSAFAVTIRLYMGNALLVLGWNYLFFGLHQLAAALVAALILLISVIVLMLRVRRDSPIAALALLPYLLWMLVAVYINYAIWTLN